LAENTWRSIGENTWRIIGRKVTNRTGESSAAVRARVEKARDRQRERFKNCGLTCNSDMRPVEVRQFCQLDDTGRALMKTAMAQLQMTARAYHRVLKLARTIADLAGCENISTSHLAEAIQYRPRGENGYT
jgi:magnesium chelatase family protein